MPLEDAPQPVVEKSPRTHGAEFPDVEPKLAAKKINAPLKVSNRERQLMKEAIPSTTHITPESKLKELKAATAPLKLSKTAMKLIN